MPWMMKTQILTTWIMAAKRQRMTSRTQLTEVPSLNQENGHIFAFRVALASASSTIGLPMTS